MATTTEPSSARYSVTLEGLEAALAHVPNLDRRNKLMRYAVTKYAAKVHELAIHRIAVRTGTTRRTLQVRVGAEGEHGIVGRVGTLTASAQSRVALYLEKGTGIYGPRGQRIYPKHAKAFAWPLGASGHGMQRHDMGLDGATGTPTLRRTGSHTAAHARSGNAQMAFARSIRGMRAQPFFKPAIDEAHATYWPTVLREVRELAFSTTGMPPVGPAEIA